MFDPLSKPSSFRNRQLVANALVFVAVFLWWLTSQVLPARVFPALSVVAQTLYEMVTSLEFWLNAATTFARIVIAIIAEV